MHHMRLLSFALLGAALISCLVASPIQQQQRRVRTSARQLAAAPYPAAGFRPKIPFELPNERQPKRIPIATTTAAPEVTSSSDEGDDTRVEGDASDDVAPPTAPEQGQDEQVPETVAGEDDTPNVETAVIEEVPSSAADNEPAAPEQGSDITGDSPIQPIDGEQQPVAPVDNEGDNEQVDVAGEVPQIDIGVRVDVGSKTPTQANDNDDATTPASTSPASESDENVPTASSGSDSDSDSDDEEDVDDSDIHRPADAYGPPDAPESNAADSDEANTQQRDDVGKFVRAPSSKFELPQLGRAQQFAVVDVPEEEQSQPEDNEEGGILLLEPVPTYGPPTLGERTPALAYGIPQVGIDAQAIDDVNEVDDLIAVDLAAQQQRLQLLRNFSGLRSGRIVYVPMRAGQRQAVQPLRLMRRF